MSSAQEKYLATNTLACVLRICLGKETTVELRNEAFVSGRVVDVDGFMNVTLREALFTDASRNRRRFESFFVQSRLVRAVQIPAQIDVARELTRMFDPAARGRGRGARGGGGRGLGGPVDGGRKKIMDAREKRRQEDIENALRIAGERQQLLQQ